MERYIPYLWVLLTVACTCFGQLILKYELRNVGSPELGIGAVGFYLKFIFTRPLVMLGFFSAFVASFFWLLAISRLQLSHAYPFMSLNFVIVFLVSVAMFGETVAVGKVVGVSLIIVGVIVLGLFA